MPDPDTQHTIWRTGNQCPDCGRETINTNGRYGWCANADCDWTDYPNSAKVMTMSEQQVDTDTDDPQPTAGPWHADNTYISAASGRAIATAARYGNDHEGTPEDLANARLIAAAGTAASKLPDGWDAVDVLEALPKLLRAADMAVDSALFRDEDGHAHPPDRSHMLDLRSALNAARGDSNE